MQQNSVLVRDLVLIGGGHTHALVARMWGMKPIEGVRLTVINPHPTAPYSGMLPGYIAGHYPRAALEIDLVKLARFAGARRVLGHAEAVDPEAGLVRLADGREIAWDVAAIDVGIHAQMLEIEGFADHGCGAKPLDVYAARWEDFRARAIAGEVAGEVAVIGGGIAGIELALAMAHALRTGGVAARVSLIEAGADIAAANPGARRTLARAMEKLGVEVVVNARPTRITAEAVHLADGRVVASRFTVGAAGARAHEWLTRTPLPLTNDGYVRVGADLRVEGQAALFAAGDCAHMTHAPRPKAGVFAVRAAPVLYKNLAAAVTGAPMRRFHPQKHYLKLISLGDKSAIVEKWGRAASGPALWRWKDRIDRKFMDKFHALPAMPAPPMAPHVARALEAEGLDASRPLCGGCGSKVAPLTLSAALAELAQTRRADVLSVPGDDAAVLAGADGPRQVLTTDHLRAFTNDHALLARITAVHALGALWAMGATPQAAPLSATLPRMSEALQARSMAETL
ncbi:MAG TPA: bifunctional NADH dehydrogenase FAD-containing subunit/selenide, water dikinase SelD, partial [Aliiroseovarius sp.]|nr:bifunctional NADH dehydrogenase FAD-containing subunit/selenide, water dikinase SelD [Aliiroseovarius sp.]